MSEWTLTTIEDVAERVAMGPFGSSIKVSTFVDVGVPVISGQHLRESRLTDSTFNFVSEEHATQLSKANVQRGDVILTHAGTIGQVSLIPETSRYDRYVISQRQFYIRCDQSKMLPEFLTYYLRSREGQHKILANANQTGVPSIAQPVSYIRTVEVPLPPLAEQRAIAGVLGALDDKIESNRRICEQLDLLADATYLGSSSNHSTAASEVFRPILGGTPKRGVEEYWTGGIPWVSAKDISTATAGFVLETVEEISEAGVAFSAAKVLESGSVVITARGTVGALARLSAPMAFNQSCYGLQPLGSYRHSLIYRALKIAVKELKQMAHGTVFDTITMETFKSLTLRVPDLADLQTIQDELEQLDDLTMARSRESIRLARMRDALLPELLSGRLRVRDAEKVVEEVV